MFCHSVEGQKAEISSDDVTEHESGTSRLDMLHFVSIDSYKRNVILLCWPYLVRSRVEPNIRVTAGPVLKSGN